MLTLPKVLLFCMITLLVVCFYRGLRVRERVLITGNHYCREFGFQLLDETVQRERLWLTGLGTWHWQIGRRFRFEYTEDGLTRKAGTIVTLGERVQMIEFDGQRVLQ